MTNRRDFFKLLGMAAAGSLVGYQRNAVDMRPADVSPMAASYQGADFSGWEVVVGDGVWAAPGEPPVDDNDIETVNCGDYSELRANIQARRIMAHNITFRRIIDERAFDYVHTCGFAFRLPYLPATSNIELNGQTVEGGIFIWDGRDSYLDYGIAFQWMVNPWGGDDFSFGDIRCWTDRDGGSWAKVGALQPDTLWHDVKFVLDCQRETTALTIDGIRYPSSFTGTTKPETWGTEIAARLQAEIISLYLGDAGPAVQHVVEFADWYWSWELNSACRVYLPLVLK